jgi:hypothetical protein
MSFLDPLPENPVSVSPTDQAKAYWLSLGLGQGLEAQLEAADVLIVPEKSQREGVSFYFHQDAGALYQFLQQKLSGVASVELCANDSEYVEIALHSSVFRLGGFLVTVVVAPLLVNLLSDYISDQLKAKPTDVVEATIIVEDHECKAFKLSYKGEAQGFGQMADQVGQLARDCAARAPKSKGKLQAKKK